MANKDQDRVAAIEGAGGLQVIAGAEPKSGGRRHSRSVPAEEGRPAVMPDEVPRPNGPRGPDNILTSLPRSARHDMLL